MMTDFSRLKFPRLLLAAVALVTAGGSQAATLAFTDFNDSTRTGANDHIKTNLNWSSLTGLEDPGDMAALNASSANQILFDSTLGQDVFAPLLNVGNGNTFWTTDISITVASGFSVTLTDITFNAISLSGGGAENVDRRNDYTAYLFDPSLTELTQVTVADVFAGTTAGRPLVTLNFADTALTEPGTYILRIQGGDYTGTNETGNHTGLDNLSINGIAIPEPSTMMAALMGLALLARRRRG